MATGEGVMRLMGIAFSCSPRSWALGWRLPYYEPGQPANPYEEGDWWLCLGPLALMFVEV